MPSRVLAMVGDILVVVMSIMCVVVALVVVVVVVSIVTVAVASPVLPLLLPVLLLLLSRLRGGVMFVRRNESAMATADTLSQSRGRLYSGGEAARGALALGETSANHKQHKSRL